MVKIRIFLNSREYSRVTEQMAGRRWRAACAKWKWKCRTSAGVGQDVRLVWPGVIADWITVETEAKEPVTEGCN